MPFNNCIDIKTHLIASCHKNKKITTNPTRLPKKNETEGESKGLILAAKTPSAKKHRNQQAIMQNREKC